ncbi:MAG: molybdopterin-dependent oxidoreductase [Spirochaetaceae bacterium]|nr:MAG: molybdopterin-dependent oxidoreductase [Spirochaetaceae bacterium]
MKRYNRITIFMLIAMLGLVAAGLLGCSGQKQTTAEIDTDESTPWISGIGGAYPLVEGLHVTGTPVDIDIESYRLKISGAVDTPLALSLAEIQAMESQREFVSLVCPGFFVDEGHWTGVRIADLLDLAGIKEGATQVNFVAADGNYSATLKLDVVMGGGMLIAYAFEDKALPKVHGYPLRVVAKDQQGNRWVKWLGEIVVQ